jgi:excisionase family DNA binding protein
VLLPELLDADELAVSLKTSRRQIYRWQAEYGLPCIRIGRSLLFAPAQVERWLGEHSTDTQEQPNTCPTTTEAPATGASATNSVQPLAA